MLQVPTNPPTKRRQLLLGCGTSRVKKLNPVDCPAEFEDLVTLDIDPNVHPDVVHDLNQLPWPFLDNEFDEIHAYEVLEHFGQQGDFHALFAHFQEIDRILKPDGLLIGSVPRYDHLWAWGDPGHTRIINEGTLVFLDQSRYGKPPMTDYRYLYKGDLRVVIAEKTDVHLTFLLRKHE